MASDKAVIRVFMYGFLAAAAAMLVFQNGKQKSNYGLDSGLDDQFAHRTCIFNYQ